VISTAADLHCSPSRSQRMRLVAAGGGNECICQAFLSAESVSSELSFLELLKCVSNTEF
jgi:hypothetical protein